MIIVAGKPWTEELPGLGETGQLALAMKRQAEVVYRYAVKEDLVFEFTLRDRIADASRALSQSGAKFETFEHTKANPFYWTITDRGGMLLRPEVQPAAAIRDIFTSGALYAFECATAVVIVLYKAVLDTIGEEAFNRLFRGIYLYSWEHDSDMMLITDESAPYLFPGDIVYFKNPGYPPDHPEWQGQNAVKLDEFNYYGHGTGVTSGQMIIQMLNQRRRPWSFRSAYLMNMATYPNFAALRRRVFPDRSFSDELHVRENAAAAKIGSRIRIVSV